MAEKILFLKSKLQKAFPAIAFFGGFFWDAFTLGQSITHLDLALLFLYLSVSAGILVYLGRRKIPDTIEPENPPTSFWEKAKHWIKHEGPFFSLQFCFGSMFSALSVCYFLSSSYWPSFLLIFILGFLLCVNEFIESHYHRFSLTWLLFSICAILYFNFALPMVMHSIHPIWFYISTALGVFATYGLKKISHQAAGSFWPTYMVAALLVLLFLANAIPPVPLVKKQMTICRSLEKNGISFTAKIEKPKFWNFWSKTESNVQQYPGEKIYCFTSIFLPPGISCTLYHRWMHQDPRSHDWKEVSRMGFFIRGGRKEGFRGYTYKRNLPPGNWKVKVETESGRILGTIGFSATSITDSQLEYKVLNLD